MPVPVGTSIGVDLSTPVRVGAFSHSTGEVLGVLTAKTPFDMSSKAGLKALAGEIREFCKPLGRRLQATVGLPMSDCLLSTVAMPDVKKRDFDKAVQFEIERLAPGGRDSMRTVVREWPEGLPFPPSAKVPEGTKLYLVAAADAGAVVAAQYLMKSAGLRSLGIEIPANSAGRGSWWLWDRPEPAVSEAAATSSLGSSSGDIESMGVTTSNAADAYMPWITHGNGTCADPGPGGAGGATTPLSPVDMLERDAEKEDASSVGPGVILDISIVVKVSEAIMYLSYGACPWLMREIPLDPDNPFVNGQVLSGEITRSARFARASSSGQVDGRVTVFGSSDRVSFLADFLKEQTGLRTRLWGRPFVDSDPEYGVAIGLTIPHIGGPKQ